MAKSKARMLLREAPFHGANKLADKNFSLYWTIFLLMLLVMATMLICFSIFRFLDNPTYLVKFESIDTVSSFPSVILCPEVLYSDEKIDSFLSQRKLPNGYDIAHFRQIIRQLAAFYAVDVPYEVHDLKIIEELLDINNIDVETAGRQLTNTCEETLLRCRWKTRIVNCSDVFTMELTGEGFCCVFNGRSMKRDLKESQRYHVYHNQWQTRQFGFFSGLMLVVNQTQKPASIDGNYKWIALQTSQHYVDSSINGTPLNPGTENWIEYHKWNFQIAETARHLDPSLRKCNLATEVYSMQYFPVYKKSYCLLECEIRNTLHRCECLRLVHPSSPGQSYCGANKLSCSRRAMVDYNDNYCNCPKTCDIESIYTRTYNFNLHAGTKPLDTFYHGLDYDKVTIVKIYVHKRLRNTFVRWSYFSFMDLFSQIGGMFNIFFGCSVLTVLALFQMFVQALIVNRRNNILCKNCVHE